jgi:hypothetical protein
LALIRGRNRKGYKNKSFIYRACQIEGIRSADRICFLFSICVLNFKARWVLAMIMINISDARDEVF